MATTTDHEFVQIADGTTGWGATDRARWEQLDGILQYVRFNLYVIDNEVPTEIATQDTPVRVEYGTPQVLAVNGGMTLTADGVRYDGNRTRVVTVNVAAAVESVGNNQRYLFTLRKNGEPVPQLRARARLGSGGDVENVAAVGLVELEPGDVLSTWVQNEASDNDLIVVDGSFVVQG